MVFKKFQRSDNNFPPRKMFQGNWSCADCGKEITELPYQPSPDRPVYCKECWLKRKEQRGGDRGYNREPRQTIQGNWKCSECGKEITELPFQPAPDRPIYCRDCWSQKRTRRF